MSCVFGENSSVGLSISVSVFHFFGGKFVYEFLERCKFLAVNKVELLHKEDEMFERCVEMGLFTQLHHLLEVLVVDVGVHAEQSLQDGLGNGQEVFWKRDSCTCKTNNIARLVNHGKKVALDCSKLYIFQHGLVCKCY